MCVCVYVCVCVCVCVYVCVCVNVCCGLDVDECVEQEGVCAGVGQCVNDVGSYHCSCPSGYQQVNSTSCLGEDLGFDL